MGTGSGPCFCQESRIDLAKPGRGKRRLRVARGLVSVEAAQEIRAAVELATWPDGQHIDCLPCGPIGSVVFSAWDHKELTRQLQPLVEGCLVPYVRARYECSAADVL